MGSVFQLPLLQLQLLPIKPFQYPLLHEPQPLHGKVLFHSYSSCHSGTRICCNSSFFSQICTREEGRCGQEERCVQRRSFGKSATIASAGSRA